MQIKQSDTNNILPLTRHKVYSDVNKVFIALQSSYSCKLYKPCKPCRPALSSVASSFIYIVIFHIQFHSIHILHELHKLHIIPIKYN